MGMEGWEAHLFFALVAGPRSDDRIRAEMDVTIALVADAANISREGKLNVLGAFNNIFATSYPATHPEMQLVLRIQASASEQGFRKSLKVLLLDADGNQQEGFRLSGEFDVPAPGRPGQKAQMETIIRLIGTTFPHEGDYSLAILINEEEKAFIPISVGPPLTGQAKGND